MAYIILRGRWCDVIFLNVHAPTEDKILDVKDSFDEILERSENEELILIRNRAKRRAHTWSLRETRP
jgi:hypothetical protein